MIPIDCLPTQQRWSKKAWLVTSHAPISRGWFVRHGKTLAASALRRG
ncbi:MAG: hypothetical protein MJE68_13900 [Proteobacteria bacterium]|nr:hypothetical protein [Pseudomonadota bacterium]